MPLASASMAPSDDVSKSSPFFPSVNFFGQLWSLSTKRLDAGRQRKAANSSNLPCDEDFPGRQRTPPLRRILSSAARLESKKVQLKKCSYVGNCHIYEPHDVYCCLDFFLLLVCDRLTTRNTHGLDLTPYISRSIKECTLARSQHPLDMTNISIHHWRQNTNVRSVFRGCENRCKRRVGTGSVETVYY